MSRANGSMEQTTGSNGARQEQPVSFEVHTPGDRPLLHCSRQPVRRFFRYGLISAVIGLGVSLIIGLADPAGISLMETLGGVVMGVAIGSGSILMELALLRHFVRLPLMPVLLARCVSYFLGGVAGHLAGGFFVRDVMGLAEWSKPTDLGSMVVYALVAVGVGMTFHTVESLRTSLAEKVSALKEREYADKELATARLIQKRLMPPESTSGPGFRLAASNRAAEFVAGDFYDYFHLPDGTMGFAIADVAGKGLGASLQMATVKAMLPLIAAQRLGTDDPVAGTLEDLNQRLAVELHRREFVAMLYGRFDPNTGTVEFANAGLPDPYWVSDDRTCDHMVTAMSVPGERLPLGVRRGTRYTSRKAVASEPGTFVVLTDGLVERSVAGEPLGYERFEQILGEVEPQNDPAEWMEAVQRRVHDLGAGVPEDDDCTMMVIRCAEVEASSPADEPASPGAEDDVRSSERDTVRAPLADLLTVT